MSEALPQQNPLETKDSFVLPELLPGEEPEEYLFRVNSMSEYTNTNESGVLHAKSPQTDWKVIAAAVQKVKERHEDSKLTQEKRESVRSAVERAFIITSGPVYSDEHGLDFSSTNDTRLFADEKIGTHNDPYSITMFGVPLRDEETCPEVYDYLKELVHDKNIMLLGGGNSAMDLIVPSGNLGLGLRPHKVINIDKYNRAEDIEKGYDFNKDGERIYESVVVAAEDTHGVLEALHKNGLADGVDEIWAQYSVPYYLESIDAVRDMFETVRRSLAPGGTARLYPIGMNIPMRDVMRIGEIRKQFVNLVDQFNEDPDFKAYVAVQHEGGSETIYSATLIIKRLKSPL